MKYPSLPTRAFSGLLIATSALLGACGGTDPITTTAATTAGSGGTGSGATSTDRTPSSFL